MPHFDCRIIFSRTLGLIWIASTNISSHLPAQKQGWTSVDKAITGGADWVGEKYIDQGQTTMYLNKFDLVGPEYYTNQFVQNIAAASDESLDQNLVFQIPAFKDLPDKPAQLPPKK